MFHAFTPSASAVAGLSARGTAARMTISCFIAICLFIFAGCGGSGSGNGIGDVDGAPTIGSIADQTTSVDTAVGPIQFTVGDEETPVDDLLLSVSSDNDSLLPVGNIDLAGSGADRTITLTPVAGQSGTATVTLTVENASDLSATTSFQLTVIAESTPPNISAFADQTTISGAELGPIAFTIGDDETPVADLVVSASSDNPTLLPEANLIVGGSAADRTLTLTPIDGETGTVNVTVTVENDSGLSASSEFEVTVTAIDEDIELSKIYVIIDISEGPDATHYPVTESEEAPEDLNSDLYKTDRIVLRRIPAGTFLMGSPDEEDGRFVNEDQRQVTLTQDYYIGVFTVTQAQWLNVMGGSNPSLHTGDTRPVEQVSWIEVRGGTWNGPEGGEPDAESFMAILSERAGIDFDLPTEAQWEYAARAGTTSAFNNGGSLTAATASDNCTNLDQLGRYAHNGGMEDGSLGQAHAPVGSYLPNDWGIYDMHGNVSEHCLDIYVHNVGTDSVIDPAGPTSTANFPWRTERGGAWDFVARENRSAIRASSSGPFTGRFNLGFRLAVPPRAVDLSPELVSLPAATFTQGRQEGSGFTSELPTRQVTLSQDFEMASTAVTNAQYAAMLNWALDPHGDGTGALVELDDPSDPSEVLLVAVDPRDGSTAWQHRRLLGLGDSDSQIMWHDGSFAVRDVDGHPDGDTASRANHPVVFVTWYGSQFYCWVLNERSDSGDNPISMVDWSVDIAVPGWRLPTEAEWEYAARGGWDGGARWPWWTEDEATHSEPDADLANFDKTNSHASGEPYTSVVGSYPANGFGLYDMAGNVEEWCSDWFDSDAYDAGDATDPEGPATGSERARRGGSWTSAASFIRCARRNGATPDNNTKFKGFRPVKGQGLPGPESNN